MDGRETHLSVLLKCEHDFWGAIPAGRDVFCHEARLGPRRLRGLNGARKAEVADLEVTIGVEKEVRRLEVAVDDVCRVQRLERAQILIDKVLCVVVREVLRADDAVHVRLHQLLDHWLQCIAVGEREQGAQHRGGRATGLTHGRLP